jgi:PAS domain S-box-containing protein
MPVPALLEAVGYGLLVLTTAQTLRRLFRYRDAASLDVLMLLVSIVGARGLQVQAPALWAGLVFARPYLLLRLVAHFRVVNPIILALTLAAIPVGVVGYTWHANPFHGWWSAGGYSYLAVTSALVAIALLDEGKRTAGVTAKRLQLTASGTLCLVVVFAAASAVRWAPELQAMATQTEWLTSASLVSLYLAFSPPRRLVAGWQRYEQAKYLSGLADSDPEARGRRGTDDLCTALTKGVGNSLVLILIRPQPTADELVATASSIPAFTNLTDTPGAGIVGRVMTSGVAELGWPSDCEFSFKDRLVNLGARLLVAPIATDSHTWGVSLVVQRRGSLFPDDDLRLMAQLGRHAATALDHAQLVIERRERERRIADRRLREVETRMGLMLDSITDHAMFVIDDRGRVAAWHLGAQHIFGYTPDEITDHSAAPLFGTDPVVFQSMLDEAKRVGYSEWDQPCTKNDGTRFVGVTSVRPLETEFDEPPGFVVITRDVTERRDLEGRLRQSQKMEAVGQLAGGIAHDFNNLLTAIIGYADLLESGLQADPSLRGSLGEIQRAAERAAGLTRQLLAFSRRQVLQSTEIEITALVRDLIPMLRRLIGEHISIQDRTTPNLGRVLGDRSQVEQIVINLVVNARDAMPNGGPITIATSKAKLDAIAAAGELEPGQYLLLEVSDTGIGMDAATQSRIFEPFFTTKEIGYGTGLGLATVYGIVKQMNGAVRVQSDVGIGTTFRIYLPETTTKVSVETPLAAGLPGGTETLLLVEDDDAVRAFLTHTLETHGYQVIAAAHPSMAIALADSHDDVIHLAIADVVLPGSSGLELARALAERRPSLQVLYISGYADATIARDGGVLKSMHFLQKPFSAGDLLRRIRTILPAP